MHSVTSYVPTLTLKNIIPAKKKHYVTVQKVVEHFQSDQSVGWPLAGHTASLMEVVPPPKNHVTMQKVLEHFRS